MPSVRRLTLLGRRSLEGIQGPTVEEHRVDVRAPESYGTLLAGHNVALCTLGVGEPSKVSKETFVEIDKTAVLNFAKAAKEAGIAHFELLASVGTNPESMSFYLRTKGELIAELEALGFARLSIFQPSMILTPNNRYGIAQGITLVVWPWLTPLLAGPLRKYRGVKVEALGRAMAANIATEGAGVEFLQWDDFHRLAPS